MIKLTARVQIFGDGNSQIDDSSLSIKWVNKIEENKNTMSGEISSIANTRVQDQNIFLFDYSKLDGSATFKPSESAKYYISEERTSDIFDETTQMYKFDSACAFKFTVPNECKAITIVFDDKNDCYPKKATLKYKSHSVVMRTDDAIVSWDLSSFNNPSSFEITATMEGLNKPNAPLIIRGIYADLSIDLDYRNLISISGKIFDRSDINLPSFGIISNSGNIEFNDTDGEILDYIENGWLKDGLEVKMWLTNTLANNKQTQMGTYTTANWSYDNDNRSVSVSLVDNLVEWQDIHNDGFSYNIMKPNKVLENRTTKNLYMWLRSQTPLKYNMKTFELLDDVTKDHLSKIIIDRPYLESASLWSQWNKFCQATQTHIYRDYEGNIVCKYNDGN